MRKRLLLYQRIGGVPFVFSFWMAEGAVLSLPIFDPTKTIFEMDPMLVVALSTVAGSLASYFAGSVIVGSIWKLWNASMAKKLEDRQRDFYARISKYRANVPPNPTQMNLSFDYYGEKIKSVKDYKAWLRRQKKLLSDRTFKL